MNKNTHKNTLENTPLKVVIIENRPMFRKGLAGVFIENWKNPTLVEAAKIEDFLKLPEVSNPNVILIGLEDGEDKNVIQQIAGLSGKFPTAKIVLYDYQDNLKMIPRLLRLGISAYLTADFDVSELRLCFNSILEGKKYISNEIVWEYLNHESETATLPKNRLSKMEEVVANYLTQGMSVSKIAETMNRQISTISTVKAKVFKKMMVGNVLDLKDKLQKDNNNIAFAQM